MPLVCEARRSVLVQCRSLLQETAQSRAKQGSGDVRVMVSALRRTAEAFIAEFVAAKAPWIRKQQARIAARPLRPELTCTHGE